MAKRKKKDTGLATKLWIAAALLFALFVIGAMVAAIFGADTEGIGANTAVIRIIGPIAGDSTSGLFASGATSSTEIVELLHDARDDSSITGVILEMNTPGGSAVASDEIGQAVQSVRAEGKPVVTWMREVGASGGYWIASNTDHIVANRMTITGSIGVYGSYLGFSEFIDEWNVSHNRFVAGDKKDIGDPFREMSSSDKLYLQAKMDRIHEFFIEEVARNRNMTLSEARPLADGSFFLGIEAYEVGLVDELGGKDEAIAYLENVTGNEVTLTYFESEKGFFEEVFGAQNNPELDVRDLQRLDANQIWIPLMK